MREIENSELGHCPRCKSINLNYGDSGVSEAGYYYEVDCEDCGWEGQEWYNLTFSCYYEREE